MATQIDTLLRPHTGRRHLPMLEAREREQENSHGVDAHALARELASTLEGEVRFDDGARALYATDGSNYRQVPIGVVIPRTLDDVVNTLAIARAHHAPVLSRGGGTSLAGQCCNVAVVMDFSKYLHRIIEIDPLEKWARIEPGVVLDDLRHAAQVYGLSFGPDPSTHNHCTLGGMIGNNSCGVHSVMSGRTSDNVRELDVVTYDGTRMRVGPTSDEDLARIIAAGGRRGEIYRGLRSLRDRYATLIRERYPNIPRRVSGYNLDELLPERGFNVARALVGTEGTCVTILEAKVRLIDWPNSRSLLVLGYPSVYEAADHVVEVMKHGPIGLEGLDDRLVRDMKLRKIHPEDVELLPAGKGWLMVEFGGATRDESDGRARELMAALRSGPNPPSMKLFDDPAHEKMLWKVRESGLGATARVPGSKDTWEGWEDSAVPPENLGRYLRALRKLFDEYGYGCSLYGHFGEGCVHTRIDFDLLTREGIAKYQRFIHDAAKLVVSLGGSLSGEHGDGQSRAELLPMMFGDELVNAFREFKSLWDPTSKMNPGKVVDAFQSDQNLRLGTDYRPAVVQTHFHYPDDDGSFHRVAERCVGVGECRKKGEGTMCPSYMVTLEEQHSTRGRAHMLFEMMRGDTIEGWRSKEVKDSLDLCFACKACKSECPMNVDMATYKAEFLSHYYKRRLRPIHAYAFGMIDLWARLSEPVPWLANFFTQTPVISRVMKWLLGMPQERHFPAFARQSFRRWWATRPRVHSDAPKVILWADTFNNHFHPDVAIAAVDVLEHAGFRVEIPRQHLCCGRPLYDFGMLDRAKRLLRQTLHALRADIEAGVPVVGLEPSCMAVFRDEMCNLLPQDEHAHRLREQSFVLSEFLAKKAPLFQLPTLHRKAVVHGHCHHKSVLDWNTEKTMLEKLGLDVEAPDSGCCGMAGSFGFERDHYDVSMAAGERVILPAVRDASHETLIVSDGFSCREQISQGTDRRALHFAQVVQMALHQGPDGPHGEFPERHYLAPDQVRDETLVRTK